jgi:hypothetical protein
LKNSIERVKEVTHTDASIELKLSVVSLDELGKIYPEAVRLRENL